MQSYCLLCDVILDYFNQMPRLTIHTVYELFQKLFGGAGGSIALGGNLGGWGGRGMPGCLEVGDLLRTPLACCGVRDAWQAGRPHRPLALCTVALTTSEPSDAPHLSARWSSCSRVMRVGHLPRLPGPAAHQSPQGSARPA